MNDEKKSWDEAAGDYQKVFTLGISEYSAALLRFWQEEGMIRPGCRVLDIGCGVGKYGTYLAGLGCDVTLTDLSDEMIRQAERNMAEYDTPWRVYACDFREASGAEPAFAEGFDFVFSTMSPAIDGADAVRKMSALSRGWCFLARFQSWEQPTRDLLMRKMGVEPRPMMDRLSDDVAAMVRAVEEAGYAPRVKVVPYDWADERSPEDMADYLCRRYFEPEEREGIYPAALAAAAGLAGADGLIRDAVNTTAAWICWRI